MSNVPENLLYSKTHEWASRQGDSVTVGITDYAQHQLTDVVFVEFPKIGAKVKKRGVLLTIESVKSAEDVFSPVDGTVVEINKVLETAPEKLNEDPYKQWLVKIKPDSGAVLDGLSAGEYRKHIGD